MLKAWRSHGQIISIHTTSFSTTFFVKYYIFSPTSVYNNQHINSFDIFYTIRGGSSF